jgi:hypothetical protein
MISSNEARDLLLESMNEFITRKKQFTIGDMLAEINVVAVKFILDNYSPQTSNNPTTYLQVNKSKYGSIARVFATAMSDQYPAVLTPAVINDLVDNICKGIGYADTPLAIAEYLKDRHGKTSDLGGENYDFMSSRHERYQFDFFVEASDVHRLVHINASPNWKSIVVTITPTLSAKTAHLTSRQGNTLFYTGSDPDYEFVIELDDLDEVIFFSLIRKDRGLRLDYYE